jgi:hypothetical protein
MASNEVFNEGSRRHKFIVKRSVRQREQKIQVYSQTKCSTERAEDARPASNKVFNGESRRTRERVKQHV